MTATVQPSSRTLARADLLSGDVAELISEIDPTGAGHMHRKAWEQAMTVLAFRRAGVLDRDGTCLSVAAGHEALLYYLTRHFRQVVASDIYADSGSWAADEGDIAMLVDPDRFAPYPYERRRLLPVHLDALDLRFEDESFDAAYSLSSVEHMGGFDGAVSAIAEMARVTRRGGCVVVTTEVAVDGWESESLPHTEIFSPAQLTRLVAAVGTLEWLDGAPPEPVDEGIEPVPLMGAISLRLSAIETAEHLRVRAPSGTVFTSVCLALRRT